MPEGMPPESYAGHEMYERALELFSGLDEEGRMAARAGVEVALKEGDTGMEESPPDDRGEMAVSEEGGGEESHDKELELPQGTPMMIVIRKKAAHKACPSGDEH